MADVTIRGMVRLIQVEVRRHSLPVVVRMARKIVFTDTCWLWTGCRDKHGYGFINLSRKQGAERTHRVTYEMFVGPLVRGYHLDHLCRVTNCCNPAHLEAVTPRVNILRGTSVTRTNTEKTHCRKGHPYVGDNLWEKTDRKGRVSRVCRTCKREWERLSWLKKKSA